MAEQLPLRSTGVSPVSRPGSGNPVPEDGSAPVIAYLTSLYARSSDTFVRREVAELRKLGFTVHTYSIRRPTPQESLGADVAAEQANTVYLLEGGLLPLLRAGLAMLFTRPRRWLSAALLAWRCSSPGFRSRLWHLAYLLEGCLLARAIQGRGVRHLHNHIGENSAAVAMLASALSGIPYSLTVHGPREFDHPHELALDRKIAGAKFVVAVSSFGRSQLYRWCDVAHWPKVQVVRCGVDSSFLGDDAVPVPPRPRLVSVGRLAEQKGQLLLVEAARKLADEGMGFELVLIGDGPLREALQRRIDAAGLRDRVRLAGWMDNASVRREVLASRALVLPSFAEGLPVVLMEALALGRPVISTWIAGIPELVEDGVSGWLVPAGSAEDLAAAMREALSADPAQVARMGAAGARRVRERHNVSVEAARLADLLRESSREEAKKRRGTSPRGHEGTKAPPGPSGDGPTANTQYGEII